MNRRAEYREELRGLPPSHWEPYLGRRSGLPGPRANLELVAAVADEAPPELVLRLAGSDDEFLALCGAAALGRLVMAGDRRALSRMRDLASDPRWRVREGVAIGLQRWGTADMKALLAEMRAWAGGSPFEQRAVVAALCEPPLLRKPENARQVLNVIDEITGSLAGRQDRSGAGFRALRQALAYGWSVAVAALPETGKPLMEKWALSADQDVRWLIRENLMKARLRRLDSAWVDRWLSPGSQAAPPG